MRHNFTQIISKIFIASITATLQKRVHKHFLIFSLLNIFLANSVFAKDSSTYSWKQCVEMALQNNAELKSAIANEKAMKFAESGSKSNFLPQLTAATGSARSFTNTSNLASNNSFYYTTNTATVSASQNLFSGFQDMAKMAQAKANSLVAKANVAVIKAKVSYDLKSSYEGLNYAKEYLKLLADIIKRREENLRIIDLRYRAGMENKGSLLLARAYFSDAEYNLLQAQNLKETARAQLCKALGMQECVEFDIVGGVPIKAPQDITNFESLVEKTPQHIQAVAQEQAAQAGVAIAESGFFPIVSINGMVGKRGTTFAPQNDYWSVGLNVSLPFFTGGKDYYATQSAFSSKAYASYSRETTDRQALADLRQKYSAYIESVAKLQVSENYRDAAKMRAEIARNKYNNGLLIFENWDVIESDLINRQTVYLQSKRDRVINEAAWEQIQGKGVYDD